MRRMSRSASFSYSARTARKRAALASLRVSARVAISARVCGKRHRQRGQHAGQRAECRSRRASCACPQEASSCPERGWATANLSAMLWPLAPAAIPVPWASATGLRRGLLPQMRQFRLTGLFMCDEQQITIPTAGIPSWAVPACQDLPCRGVFCPGEQAVAVDRTPQRLWLTPQGRG